MLFSIHFRAENETRTRDPNLGKVVLYQLSYFRVIFAIAVAKVRILSKPASVSLTFFRIKYQVKQYLLDNQLILSR